MLGSYYPIQVLDGFIIIIIMNIFWQHKQHTLKPRHRHFNIQLQRKNLWQQKGKNALLQLIQRMKVEHERSRMRPFVSTIVLKICFSCLHFFSFVILDVPHFAMSHFVIFMNLFVSCRFQGIRNFHKISGHCGTTTWANDMQLGDNNSFNNDDDDNCDNDNDNVIVRL